MLVIPLFLKVFNAQLTLCLIVTAAHCTLILHESLISMRSHSRTQCTNAESIIAETNRTYEL